MKIISGKERERLQVSVSGTLYAPFLGKGSFLNLSGAYNPFTINSELNSGSPWIAQDGLFIGFLKNTSGLFRYVKELNYISAEIPKNQELLVIEGSKLKEAAQEYNKLTNNSQKIHIAQQFNLLPEYCTWTEQKIPTPSNPRERINHDFVISYAKKIKDLGLPDGKLTIDCYWCDPKDFGDWTVNQDKFPDIASTASVLENLGFIPGLWIAPYLCHPDSKFANNNPNSLDMKKRWMGQIFWFLKPTKAVELQYTEVFQRIIDWGFRKIKIDISYGNKRKMGRLLELFSRIIRSIDNQVEIEAHMPDPNYSIYSDMIRTNDVFIRSPNLIIDRLTGYAVENVPQIIPKIQNGLYWLKSRLFWQKCRLSTPGKLLNLDYCGGNSPHVSTDQYLMHLKNYLISVGSPAFALIPSRFGIKAIKAVKNYLDFYSMYKDLIPGSEYVESLEIPAKTILLKKDGRSWFFASETGKVILNGQLYSLPKYSQGFYTSENDDSEMMVLSANDGQFKSNRKIEIISDITTDIKVLNGGITSYHIHRILFQS